MTVHHAPATSSGRLYTTPKTTMSAQARSVSSSSSSLFVGFALLFAACATSQDPDIPSYQPSPGAGTGGTGTTPTAGTTATPSGGTGVIPTPTAGTTSTGGTTATPTAGTTATGGTTATAGTTATGGTTPTGTCPQYTGTLAKDSMIFMAGFGTAATGTPKWSGYGYTYKYGTATIAPGMGNGCFAAAKFCANGSVPADDKSGAGLGWNIAQMLNSMTMSTVAIATPVKISFAGGVAGMRAQLSESPTVSYCYPLTAAEITAGVATIPAASFKTECWGTTGTAYAGTPIAAIQVVVPGSAAGAVQPFDFCITDIEPG